MAKGYWLDLFTWKSWNEFLKAGGNISGFKESRWNYVKKIKPGDTLLCYLTGISRFIGALEVLDKPFKDETKIWEDDVFSSRLKVKIVYSLNPQTAVPVKSLRNQLSCFKDLKSPNAWTGAFRGSPSKWSDEDGAAVMQALDEALRNPIERPFDEKKLEYKPKIFKTKEGAVVTLPDDTDNENVSKKEYTAHTEIQYLLLKLGSDMGFEVWAARNDKNKEYNGNKFSDIKRFKKELPNQFEDYTNRIIELIDVLWLSNNSYQAAFEVESTTSIYSGILRMSDLISMVPNVKIPMYLVAPKSRREKVIKEVNRPTFTIHEPKLNEICSFLSFEALKERIKEIGSFAQFLKPEFLDEIAEPCVIEEE